MTAQNTQETTWRKIKILLKTINKTYGWYTGLPLKRYLKETVFSHKSDFKNPTLDAGRWSAYCHYGQETAVKNLLQKHEITSTSRVIIHPLTPAKLVALFEETGCEILTHDINKDTLNWDSKKFVRFVKKEHLRGVDLVVFYGFNGLYEDITKVVVENEKQSIPSMIILDTPTLNLSTLTLFETLDLGSVVWNFGESFVDHQLTEVLETPLPGNTWYVSWYFETRTKSILEYHLSESQPLYESLIDAYFFLLIKQYENMGWRGWIYNMFVKHALLRNNFTTIEEAQKSLIEDYQQLPGSALPDVFFELENLFHEHDAARQLTSQFLQNEALLQTRARNLYDFLVAEVPQKEEGSIEIPNLFLDQIYLHYFFYTADINSWIEILDKRGIQSYTLHPLYIGFDSHQKLENAHFIRDFLLIVNITGNTDLQLN